MTFTDKNTRQEIKRGKKEARRCKKLYPDWEDNEFNCGPLKFIWGVISHDDMTATVPSFYSMNDLDICYNRDTKKYLLGLETIYSFLDTGYELQYLEDLLAAFTKFMKDTKRKVTSADLTLLPFSMGELFIADSIEELYLNFKLFVRGYVDLKRRRKK